MVRIPLEKLLDLDEVVLFSQLYGRIPLIQEDAAVDCFLYFAHFEVGLASCFAKTHGLESLSKGVKNRRILWKNSDELLKLVKVFQFEVSLYKALVVLGILVILCSFQPLSSFS